MACYFLGEGYLAHNRLVEAAEAYEKVYADLPRSRFVKYRPGWLPEND